MANIGATEVIPLVLMFLMLIGSWKPCDSLSAPLQEP